MKLLTLLLVLSLSSCILPRSHAGPFIRGAVGYNFNSDYSLVHSELDYQPYTTDEKIVAMGEVGYKWKYPFVSVQHISLPDQRDKGMNIFWAGFYKEW